MWNCDAPVMAWALLRPFMLLAALAGVLPGTGAAHDIPADVRIVAYMKPAADRLQLLVRVPLVAMREVDFPVRGPGYLDLPRVDAALAGAASLWLAGNIELYEGESRLAQPKLIAARVSLASDKSFATFESAMAHLRGARIPHDTDLYWNQQLLDVLFEVPIQSAAAEFSIHPKLTRLGQRVATTLRFLPPGGAERRSNFTAIPAWCGSTRAGIRRRCASLNRVFCTSSRASTTCCSCCVW